MSKAFEDGCWAARNGLRREANHYADATARQHWYRGYDGTRAGMMREAQAEPPPVSGHYVEIPLAVIIVVAGTVITIVSLLSGGAQ